jgi:hypothetical protein
MRVVGWSVLFNIERNEGQIILMYKSISKRRPPDQALMQNDVNDADRLIVQFLALSAAVSLECVGIIARRSWRLLQTTGKRGWAWGYHIDVRR